MRKLRAFGAFCYDFIIGDDWRLAVGVLAGLGLSALVTHNTDIAVWWLLPLVVIVMLFVSLSAATRRK